MKSGLLALVAVSPSSGDFPKLQIVTGSPRQLLLAPALCSHAEFPLSQIIQVLRATDSGEAESFIAGPCQK